MSKAKRRKQQKARAEFLSGMPPLVRPGVSAYLSRADLRLLIGVGRRGKL